MDLSTVLPAVVALSAPFGLRFDQGGLGGAPWAVRGRQVLFAAMIALAWLCAPLLAIETHLAARRGFGGRRG